MKILEKKGLYEFEKDFLKQLVSNPEIAPKADAIQTPSKRGIKAKIYLWSLEQKQIVDITSAVAKLLELKLDKNKSRIILNGVGLDLVFYLFYELTKALNISNEKDNLASVWARNS